MKKLFRVGRQKPKVQVEPLQRLTPRRKAPIYLLESEPIYLQEAPIYLQDAAPLQFSANEGRGAFDQTVVVGSLLTFVVNACDHRSLAGRNAHEVAHLRQVLDGYLASTTSDDVVHAIIQSLEIRKVLLDIVSKLGLAADPNLRAAQRSDSERIATLLAASFKSEDDKNTILNLSGDSAQSFLDVIQESLDKGLLLDAEQSRMARSMIRKLSESCDSLPSSLFIPNGVHACEQYPTFGGGFGDIYRAIMHDKPVALKRMRHFLRGSDLRRIHLKFCREALIWKELQNPYILPLIGIDRDSFPSSLCMVSPWMEQGTAISYLKEHGHATVDKLLLEIARGLEYLHSRNIIHGDLKGANILIQGNGTACLADFGLSNFSDVTTSMSTNRGGSVYWMAPELLDPDQFEFEFTRTPATDVYAFGCVCFELYTGRPPFANLRDGVAAIKVIMGERAVRPSGLPAMSDLLWQHVTLYWAHSPTTRPTTLQVVQNMCLHIPSPQPRTEGLNYSLNTRIQGQLSQRHPVVVDGDVEEFFGIGDRPNISLSSRPNTVPFSRDLILEKTATWQTTMVETGNLTVISRRNATTSLSKLLYVLPMRPGRIGLSFSIYVTPFHWKPVQQQPSVSFVTHSSTGSLQRTLLLRDYGASCSATRPKFLSTNSPTAHSSTP
ncbi:kinase-like domain-containing protein [Favolaschia claudopus]|uniref:Kinase-like domain-containing protein n=1 Tax=Favolaschia claudopus TaxID=2862362 RepID=A0AAW0BN83_9AGAR